MEIFLIPALSGLVQIAISAIIARWVAGALVPNESESAIGFAFALGTLAIYTGNAETDPKFLSQCAGALLGAFLTFIIFFKVWNKTDSQN